MTFQALMPFRAATTVVQIAKYRKKASAFIVSLIKCQVHKTLKTEDGIWTGGRYPDVFELCLSGRI